MTEYWKGDAETGDKSQWVKENSQHPSRIQVVENPVLQGKYAYRVELRQGDEAYGCRATLASGYEAGGNNHLMKSGESAFYGFSVFLPSDSFVEMDKWRLVLQFKAYPDTGSPPISINIRNDQWLLNYRPTSTSSVRTKWRAPLRKNVWESFMLHIKWSKYKYFGFIELYHNNRLVVPKFYTPTIHVKDGITTKNFVALGLYRDENIPTTDVIYHDSFVAGKSYEEVRQ